MNPRVLSFMLPLSLYIHIPWCIRKCPYCDFNSHKSPESLPEQHYIETLLQDLDADLERLPPRPLHSIFIGGGTPSLLSAKAYETLLEGIDKRMTLSNTLEITLEANPSSVEQERFKAYRRLGINRLSIGIQSFNDTHLKTLGRVHNAHHADEAILAATKAGFDRFNLDIMYGLPHQTLAEAMADLDHALQFKPTHFSWYQLTLEPNTVFYKKNPPLPDEDLIITIEEQGRAKLAEAGLVRYEISAYAKDKHYCAHNLNYWRFGDYLGIGAGAHGKITLDHQILRTTKKRQPQDYLTPKNGERCQIEVVNKDNYLFEYMLNATRLEEAIPYDDFTRYTGLAKADLVDKLTLAAQKGLVTLSVNHWQVTALGRQFTNDLQALFLN